MRQDGNITGTVSENFKTGKEKGHTWEMGG